MKNKLSNRLLAELAHLESSQIDNLVTQALHLKRKSSEKGTSLDDWVRRALKKNERELAKATNIQRAQVVSILPQLIQLETDQQLLTVPADCPAVVGDYVEFGLINDEPRIVQILKRKTKLSRPNVQTKQEQLIVANIDSVVIVVSVVSPPLHPRLIDRYLIAIQNGGASPVICVNKIDLLPKTSQELEALQPYQDIGIPVFRCSTLMQKGIEDMKSALQGQTIVFVGHSGVGKSSIANAFAPELNLKAGAISHGYGRGTHTTTTSSLHRLPHQTTLIDTPGIRSFGLWDTSEDDVSASFPEFNDYPCRFRNCQHQLEPDCGVINAVDKGLISEARYDTYLRLMGELA